MSNLTLQLVKDATANLSTVCGAFHWCHVHIDRGFQNTQSACTSSRAGANSVFANDAPEFAFAFPALVRTAHSNNLTMGWFGDGSGATSPGCAILGSDIASIMAGRSAAIGFDGIRWLSNTGAVGAYSPADMRELLAQAGVAPTFSLQASGAFPWQPNGTHCSAQTWDVAANIEPSWNGIYFNMLTLIESTATNLSRPGCWASGGLLVGNMGPTAVEARTQFGAWSILSSPLMLASAAFHGSGDYHLNTEAVSVNQRYHGSSGSMVNASSSSNAYVLWLTKMRSWENKTVALHAVNVDSNPQTAMLNVNEVYGMSKWKMSNRPWAFDIWNRVYYMDGVFGVYGGLKLGPDGGVQLSVTLQPHDSLFLLMHYWQAPAN